MVISGTGKYRTIVMLMAAKILGIATVCDERHSFCDKRRTMTIQHPRNIVQSLTAENKFP